MTKEFPDQLVLVTGSAQGIGAAVARRFAAEGARLALFDRDADGLDTLAHVLRSEGAEVFTQVFDLRNATALNAAVAEVERTCGTPSVLASVAGILHASDALDMDDADWDNTFAINTTAVFRLTRAVGRLMRARGTGSIVTVGSNAAHTPRLGMAAYAASKAATSHYMRCLALELAPHGIRCNTVSPGSTDTAMQRAFANTPEQIEGVLRGSLERYRLGIPLGRIAAPEDIAEAVCFLASKRARHITMHDLVVDGGATLAA